MSTETDKQNLYPPVYNEGSMPTPLQASSEQPQQQPPYPTGQPPNYNAQLNFGQPNPVVVQPVVVTQQPAPTGGTTVVIHNQSVGRNPQAMTCPNCRALITTNVNDTPVLKTHLLAGLICVCGCWLGCCLIPYCVSSCQGQEHTCPNCNSFVGIHK